MKHTFILFTVMLLAACSAGKKSNGKPIDISSVSTVAGFVSGITGEDGTIKVFKGIPFATPPLGDLRWKPPVPPPHWEGVRKCDTFAPSALQNKPAPFAMWSMEFMAPVEPLSEDCLYLNVWTAAKYAGEKKPVIVWIHGGAFTGGSGSVPLYNGEEMARKGVVFITTNYRLGIFGFLAHPLLTAESPNRISGNYGILDQIAALKWVQTNVQSFGGDPDNVTIAGQSAGSFSVNALMISPLAKGLFHRAIAQSGGMFGTDLLVGSTLENAEKAGMRMTEILKVSSVSELRNMPAEILMKQGIRSGVVIDNYVIPPAYETFMNSRQNDVPLLTGWNADEFYFGQPMKSEIYKAESKRKYGDLTEEFLQVFPGDSDEEAIKSQKLFSALAFGWQNYCWASLQSRTGKNKSWLYYFTHIPPGSSEYGAFHSAEFAYALKTLKYWNKPFDQWDHQLAEMMSSYWVNFAANGNPNGAGLPEWPSFETQGNKVMEFGEKVRSIDLPLQPQLKFLDHYNEVNRNK